MNLLELLRSLVDPRSRLNTRRPTNSQHTPSDDGELPGGMHPRLRLRVLLGNIPLMIGTIIVLGLFLIVLFGPLWAPMNPYIAGEHIAPHYDFEIDEFIRPPLEPSEEFPLGTDQWGSDLLSMLLYGARNTLIACAFITMVRVILGVGLGGAAGWNEGGTPDQIVMGIIGVLNAVPMLISSMLLIYALDIRRGLPVFIIALSAIGWTEIAQYIRSEFIVLRKKPFIEGAQSIGLTGLATAVRHILPNVIPQLIVITFLEMGAVMMLLGELGFLGVYIGGGSRISFETDVMQFEVFTMADVPEWGAMLAEGFRYLRSKPFVVVPPAMAFLVSVFGFNTLGEGLRQVFERYSVNTAFLLKKRMLLAVAGLTAATIFIMNRTGPAPWFDRVAQAFDGAHAYEHVAALAAMDGRGIGQPGGEEAAAYIAEHFEAYDLDPGWRQNSYIYPHEAVLVRPAEQPALDILDADGNVVLSLHHQTDFGYIIEGHGGSGTVSAPLTYVGFPSGRSELPQEAYRGLDLAGQIVLLHQGHTPDSFVTEAMLRGAVGVIWMLEDDVYGSLSQVALMDPGIEHLQSPGIPIFQVARETAERIQDRAGFPDPPGTWELEADFSGEGWYAVELPYNALMDLELDEAQTYDVPSVMAYARGSDFDLADELVILFATYDGLGVDPDGTVYPGANHNASGVAMLLEVARLWQEQDLDTRRAALFIAWGGGTLPMDEAVSFLANQYSFRHLVTDNMSQSVHPVMLFVLDNVGAGSETLLVSPGSSLHLIELLREDANEQELNVEVPDDSDGFSASVRGTIPYLQLQWGDPWLDPREDALETIQPERLQELGEAFSLTLTQIFRQADY